jgi:hypothetical protein
LRTTLGLLLFIHLCIPTFIVAQSEGSKEEPESELSLRLQPENLVDGVPQAFTFILRNFSNEDLRLPVPEIDCGNVNWRGSLLLDETWQPSAGGAGWGKGKGFCDRGELYTGRPGPSIV